MAVHPKFGGKYITDEEHARCVWAFGSRYKRLIEPTLADLGLFPRGRLQLKDAPCLYVFRHEKLYETEKRSLFLHIQKTSIQSAIEVVFRKIRGFIPLDEREWRRLVPEHYQPSTETWRAFIVSNESKIDEARRLIRLAKYAYDEYFGT